MNNNHNTLEHIQSDSSTSHYFTKERARYILRFNTGGLGTLKLHNGKDILLQAAAHTDSCMSVLHQKLSAHDMVNQINEMCK